MLLLCGLVPSVGKGAFLCERVRARVRLWLAVGLQLLLQLPRVAEDEDGLFKVLQAQDGDGVVGEVGGVVFPVGRNGEFDKGLLLGPFK